MCPKVIADRQTNIVKCPNNYSKLLECSGCYTPLLLTRVKGWGPSGPSWGPLCLAGGLWPLLLEFKIYTYTYIVIMAKIAKIATTPSILIKLI